MSTTYYLAGTNSNASNDSFTLVFIDRNSYTSNNTTGVLTGRDFADDSATMVLMDKGVTNQMAGIGIASATDINDPTTLDWEYGIYATDDGLYAVKGGVTTEFADWGSDPLYTRGDFQDSVLDRLATPPSGVNGERYLIIATASGDWAGKENYITEYQDEWIFITPSEGMMTWVEDEDVYYNYNGSAWVIFSSGGASVLDDLTDVVISGTPADNELLAYDTGGNWINQTPSEAGLFDANSNIDIGSNYFEGSAWRSDAYDVQIKPLNDSYLHIRNKADTAYKPIACLSVYATTTPHATTDVDMFLVDDSNDYKYRTGAEVLSDIGASATGHSHTASDVSDFDTEVGNHTDVDLNTTHRGTTTGNPHSIDYTDAGAEQAFSKNTAFNLNFGTGTTNVPEIGATLGNSGVVVTDSNGKLITETEQTGHNLILGTGSGQVAEGDHTHSKLTNLPTYVLLTSIPIFQEDLDAYIGGTATAWTNTGVAQRIIDWSTVYNDASHYNCNYLISSTHATSLARFRLKNVTQAAYVTTYGHIVSTLYNTYSTTISAVGSGTKMIAGDTYEIWYYVVSGATGKLNSLVLNLYKEVT